jgi:hypothetical protein
MKSINKTVMIITAILSFTLNSYAQLKNAKTVTVTVTVYGNCETCKKKIETAAYQKGAAKAVWNMDSKILSLTYDSKKTNTDEVLKRIAYAGYDNDKFIAPDDAYNKLPGCCQYERKQPTLSKNISPTKDDMGIADTIKKNNQASNSNINPLLDVYTAYFALKDALTKDDGTTASIKAKELFKSIDKVQMEKMNSAQHTVWMKYMDKLSYDAEHIKGVTETEHQREHFISLSKNMFEIMKIIKIENPVYYDFCPMANDGKGANWLSLEQPIDNPYLGKKMPTCGKIQETIK